MRLPPRARAGFRQASIAAVVFCAAWTGHAVADPLPQVENIRLEGDTLVWDPVEGAAGYNINRDFSYFDTVRGALEYPLTEPGTYSVSAFDDNGNFGPTPRFDESVEFAPGEEAGDAGAALAVNTYTVTVQKTCRDVPAGGSCVAACPRSFEAPSGETVSLAYLSGGACSTSDIVEADAFVSDRTYKCTVPTFSGEVVAQGVCVRF